jgi:hypothetical protein
MEFLKQIVSGEKAHITNDSCTKVKIERFLDFTARAALAQCKQDAKCWRFTSAHLIKAYAKLDR